MTRLLIIEDDFASRELLTYLLRSQGFETAAASNGRVGLEVLESFTPHAVLCDLGMPSMNGYEFAAILRAQARWHSVKLIAVTALSMPGDSARALASGFDGYISKPIDPETFAATVLAYLPAGDREANCP